MDHQGGGESKMVSPRGGDAWAGFGRVSWSLVERKGGQAPSRANGTGKDTASGPAAQCGQNLKEEGAGEETALAKGERGKVGRVNRGGVYKAKCNKAP